MTKTRIEAPRRKGMKKLPGKAPTLTNPDSWDDFFASTSRASEDFLLPREDALPQKRKLFK